MREFTINALSAHGRFHRVLDVERALSDVVECFRQLLPALDAGTAALIGDPNIGNRTLLANSSVLAECLNHVGDKQLVREWYIYSINRSIVANSVIGHYAMRAANDEVSGHASRSLNEAQVLLGFGGIPVCDAAEVQLEHEEILRGVASISRPSLLRPHFPLYEPSDKHRLEGYYDQGEFVSPMTLSREEAQRCLSAALEDNADLIGEHRDKFVRFKLTHPGRLIYHGFEVDASDVPAALAAKFVDRKRALR